MERELEAYGSGDTSLGAGAPAEIASEKASGVDESAPLSDEGQEEGAVEEPRSRKSGDARGRIQELNAKWRRAEAEARAEKMEKLRMGDELRGLREQVSSLTQAISNPKKEGTFDKYETSDLPLLKAQYLNKDSEQYSPAMAAKIEEEYFARREREIEKRFEARIAAERQKGDAEAKNVHYLTEAAKRIGEDAAELRDPNSPLRKLANAHYMQLAQNYGGVEKVRLERPELQGYALLLAHAELRAQNGGTNGNGQAVSRNQRSQTLARSSLTTSGEAVVDAANQRRNLLSKGKVKEALATTNLVKGWVSDIKGMQG